MVISETKTAQNAEQKKFATALDSTNKAKQKHIMQIRLVAQRLADKETNTFQALYESPNGRLSVARFRGSAGDKDKNADLFGDIPKSFGSLPKK